MDTLSRPLAKRRVGVLAGGEGGGVFEASRSDKKIGKYLVEYWSWEIANAKKNAFNTTRFPGGPPPQY